MSNLGGPKAMNIGTTGKGDAFNTIGSNGSGGAGGGGTPTGRYRYAMEGAAADYSFTRHTDEDL